MIVRDCVLDLENSVDLEPGAAEVLDISRYRNHGAFLGAGEPDWVQLPSGLWVMDFDGSNDYVSLGTSLNGVLNTRATVLAWARADRYTGGYDNILSNAAGGQLTGYNLMYWNNNTRVMCWVNIGGSYLVCIVNNTPTETEWVFIATTVDKATTDMWLYVFHSGAIFSAHDGATTATAEATGTLYIGARTPGSDHWGGKIGSPKIYNYVMTQGQIRNYYEKTKYLFGVYE